MQLIELVQHNGYDEMVMPETTHVDEMIILTTVNNDVENQVTNEDVRIEEEMQM